MARVVVLGAGLTGLGTGLLLARDGHRVTVLERDQAEPVGDAEQLWERWERPGVSQFRLAHVMLGRWRRLMEQELPEVLAELEGMGGRRTGPVDQLPAAFTGGPQPGDDDLRFVQARRPVVEGALARVASRTPGLVIRRGARAASLVVGPSAVEGVPHVAGVRTGSGEAVPADVVVDAMGRRSPLADMLSRIGARHPVEERDELGSVYYGRQFRTGADAAPVVFGTVHLDGMTLLVVPGDGRTFSVLFSCASNDRDLRVLRDDQVWDRVLALFPDLTPACSAAEPITPVQVMPGGANRSLVFVHGGVPIVTGVVAVGDATMRTNPTLGRGASIGLTHARVLRDVLREVDATAPGWLVKRFADAVEAEIMPIYRRTVAEDRSRMAEVQADITGTPHPPDDPDWSVMWTLLALAGEDAAILRAVLRIQSHFLEPATALDEPGARAVFDELAPTLPRYPHGAPTRAQVLAAIGAVVPQAG